MKHKRFTIGNFSMGKIGTRYFVYYNEWIKYLSKSDSDKGVSFDNVISEAYEEICIYCKSLKLPPPPKPKLEL